MMNTNGDSTSQRVDERESKVSPGHAVDDGSDARVGRAGHELREQLLGEQLREAGTAALGHLERPEQLVERSVRLAAAPAVPFRQLRRPQQTRRKALKKKKQREKEKR